MITDGFVFFLYFSFVSEFGKYQVFLTIVGFLSIVGSATENGSVSYMLPYAKCDLELSIREQGVVTGISYFGIVFSSHLWGFLADTAGRKTVMRSAAAGTAVISLLSAFAPNKYVLILLRFLAGAL